MSSLDSVKGIVKVAFRFEKPIVVATIGTASFILFPYGRRNRFRHVREETGVDFVTIDYFQFPLRAERADDHFRFRLSFQLLRGQVCPNRFP